MARSSDILRIARHLVAAMLLLVVAAHAVAPFVETFERASGSAFSAATCDVSLACGQPVAVAKRTLPVSPALPILTVLATAFIAIAVGDRHPRQSGFGPTGPPPTSTTFSPLAPRAPPAA